jgi:peptide/nickel transport system permease protein
MPSRLWSPHSIVIGFLVVFVSATLASLIGTTSGYFGGWFDMIAQRIVDIGIALPGLIFIILVVTTLTQFPPSGSRTYSA